MALLKLMKMREQDAGHEFDLRGFGEDPIIREADPIGVLSVAGDESALKKIKNSINEYGLAVVCHQGLDQLHVQAGMTVQGGHKVQVVELYGLALFLAQHLSNSDDVTFSLWTADRLHFHLSKTDGKSFDLSHPDVQSSIRWDGFLTLSRSVSLFLNQAGFVIAKAQKEVVLDRPTVMNLMQKELAAQTSAEVDMQRKAA